MLKVKQGNTELFDIEAYQYNAEIMGDVNLSCDVYLNAPLTYFSLEMYVNINGENLYLSSFEPTGIKNTDNIYPKYSLIFESKRVQLKRKYFRDLTSQTGIDWGTEYSFYSDINDFAERFQKNLTKYFGSDWDIEIYDAEHQSNIKVLFEAKNLYLFDALKQMSETWDKEWKIVSSGATNVIQVGFPDVTLDHTFEYEGGNAGGGLTVIQKEVDTSNIITRMLSAGSTKNIPYQYFRQLSASELAAGNVQDPNVAPIFSNGYYNLMPKCFREYISGYNNQSYAIRTTNWIKGRSDATHGIYDPITYYEKNINLWGEREGIVEVNEEIFPTITDVTLPNIGLIDEVVDVEQINFNSQEIENNFYDSDNIISDLGEILNEFQSYIPFTTPNNDYSFIRYTNSIALLSTQQLVFNYRNYYGFEPTPTNKIVTSKLIIQREQSPNTWVDVHEYITVANKEEWVVHFPDSYVFDKELIYQTSISGNYRFKIDCYFKVIPYIQGIYSDVLSVITAKITNLSYGNRIDIADISDSIDDGIDNSEGYVLLSSNKYSQEFDVVGFAQQINLGLCEIRGRCQYDLSIPNENDINGTLMVAATVILQQKVSNVWNDYAFINIPFEVTHVTTYVPSVLLYGDFVGSSLQVFNYVPIGTYRLKTELRLWRNTSIPRANQMQSNVHLDLSNMYQSKLSYSPYFNIWIKDIGFNISDYQSTETAQINFTTGAIAGEDYLFDINEVTPDTTRSYNGVPSGYRLKCTKSDADKDATGLAIPNTFKQGQAGDKFILLNINMPYDPYVLNAEQRLENYVKAELDKVCDAKRAFSIEIYDPFISDFALNHNNDFLKLVTGNYIKIKHTNLIGDDSTATVQIKGITITQSKGDMFPKFAIILSEQSSITRPTITRGGGIIGDLYRRYTDLGNRFGNVVTGLTTLSGNIGRTVDLGTFNNNNLQVRGVTTATTKKIGTLPLDSNGQERNLGDIIGKIPAGNTVFGEKNSLQYFLNFVSQKINNKVPITLNETPNGTITTFTTSKIFYKGIGDLYINRVKQYRDIDYTEISANTIEFISAPKTDDIIIFEGMENTDISKISFEDINVENLCIANWGENGKISYAKASTIASLDNVFKLNVDIISFKELQYFIALDSIIDSSFEGCSSLNSIIIPNSVKSLNFRAFADSGLYSIVIPKTIQSIGNNCFEGCIKLVSVTVESIIPPILGVGVFDDDIELTNIFVPEESVDKYKIADQWENYSTIITAII